MAPAGTCDLGAGATPAGAMAFAFTVGCDPGPLGARVWLVDRPRTGGRPTHRLALSPAGASGPVVALNRAGGLAVAWSRFTRTGGKTTAVVQAVVRDGAAELGVLDRSLTARGGRVRIPVACTGMRDCAGSLELRAHGAVLARRAVRVRRGHHAMLGVRLRRRPLRGRRTSAGIVTRLAGVPGRRTVPVSLRQG